MKKKTHWARKLPRRVRSRRGQASIMIGIMTMTLLFFFFFVVNLGMLVNAKINLQNAADLAAYAGAAVQARQLNQISYLNYEMRRQYKKFLFRYYILGNFMQRNFPKNRSSSAGSTATLWSPTGRPQDTYGIPAVCMAFNANDNYCQVFQQAGLVIPTQGAFDRINDALIKQLKDFQKILEGNCESIGGMNSQILSFWLFNTDPDHQQLESFSSGLSQAQRDRLRIASSISRGLGLIPREILLKMRIDALKDYVNQQPPSSSIDIGAIENLEKSADPAAYERTIQAFYSAFYTLGNWTFSDSSSITMEELIPKELLKLEPIKAQFDTYAINFELINSRNGTDSRDCSPRLDPVVLKNKATFGVYKDPTKMTYYAIRLRATAKLLFSPWGDVELKAYAAAQPFGSRIGPKLTNESDWTWENIKPAIAPVTPKPGESIFRDFTYRLPNLPVTEGDGTSEGQGWDRNEILGTFFAAAFPPNTQGTNVQQAGAVQGNNTGTFDENDLEKAYHIAMAPNPWETGNYNILNDAETNFYRSNFDANHEAVFWAPLATGDKKDSVDNLIQEALSDVLPAGSAEGQALRETLRQNLNQYIAALRQGSGESGEGFNLIRLTDPLSVPPIQGRAPASIDLPDWMMIKTPEKLRTSWNAPADPTLRTGKGGRDGYSVKFVTLRSLREDKIKTTLTDSFDNDLPADEESSLDLGFLKH